MSTDTPGSGRVRTSDTEREQVAEILRAGAAEGRRTLGERDERLARVYGGQDRDRVGPVAGGLARGGREGPVRPAGAAGGVPRRLGRRGFFTGVLIRPLVGLWLLSGAHFFWPL